VADKNTQFVVNTYRYDPYKNFKFRIMWDGKYVAGVSKVGGLTRTTQVVTYREGGDPSIVRKSPGQTEYTAITLERGVTHDPEFENWASKVWDFDNRGQLDNDVFAGFPQRHHYRVV
jgi:phage tail-like protein